MDNKRAFLERLWQAQSEAGLSDAALAREIGVQHSTVWRAKYDPIRTFGLDFAIAACRRFPELGSLLLGDSPVGQNVAPTGNEEARR